MAAVESRDRIWLDANQIATATGGLSAGEVRILSIIESLVIGAALHDQAGLLAGLDPRTLALVLAALRHAGGARESLDGRVYKAQDHQGGASARDEPVG